MRNNASRSTALLLLRQANKTLLALLLLVLLLLGCCCTNVVGFLLNHHQQHRNNDGNSFKKSSAENNNAPPAFAPSLSSSTAQLFMIHNGFGSFGNFLNSNSNKNRTESSSSYNMAAAGGGDDEDEAAGTFRLLEIPVRDIKPGGLRLFLMFYLMGMQNTPDPNTWKADQPSTEEYIIDFWYQKDAPNKRTILSVELSSKSITFDRVGSSPTTQYLMQEAVIVQGLLDELELCAKDENVAIKDRLLILQEPDAISQAREALAFG